MKNKKNKKTYRHKHGGTKKTKKTTKHDNTCSICLEPIKRHLFTTKCGHRFHKKCFNQYVSSKNSSQVPCPYCRRMLHVGPTVTQQEQVEPGQIEPGQIEPGQTHTREQLVQLGKRVDPRTPVMNTTLTTNEKDYLLNATINLFSEYEFNENAFLRKLSVVRWDPNYDDVLDSYYLYIGLDVYNRYPVMSGRNDQLSLLFLQVFEKMYNGEILPDEILNDYMD